MKNIFVAPFVLSIVLPIFASASAIEWFNSTSPFERANQQAQLEWNVHGGQAASVTIDCKPGTIRFMDAGSHHVFECGDSLSYSSADGRYALALEPRDNAGWATAAFTLAVAGVSGVVDQQTFSLGFRGMGLARDLYKGLVDDAGVMLLQKILAAAGVYVGPINGNFFSLTEAAVKKFQSAHGIKATGFVGLLTRIALNKK